MLSIYTISFFGHRNIERASEIENALDKLLYDLIRQKDYIDFLIGRYREFDLLASAAIKRAVCEYEYRRQKVNRQEKKKTSLLRASLSQL